MALGKTVAQLLHEVSSQELSEWMAYDSLEPFGPVREDLRSGIVASVVANANRGKNTKVFTASDFMPEFDKEKPVDVAEQCKAVFGALMKGKK